MKGIYWLAIKIKQDIQIEIGALGSLNFQNGYYIYVGSAQNNLEKRLKRHLSDKKKKHWHIDYLLLNKNTHITRIFFTEKGKSHECKTAQYLEKKAEPIPKFGCSDCTCTSHLFRVKDCSFLEKMRFNQLPISELA